MELADTGVGVGSRALGGGMEAWCWLALASGAHGGGRAERGGAFQARGRGGRGPGARQP